jgi:hypothetical protein
MKFVVIDYDVVKQDLTLPASVNFNTSFHTAREAPDLKQPSEAPASFSRWLSLILRTRGLLPSAVQTVRLSRSQARLLLNAAEGSLQTRTINRMYADDIADEISPVLENALTFPPEGLFLRLAACSPKDGAHLVPGRMSIHTVDEIILRIVTSSRARNALFQSLGDGEESFDLFFLPFDARMRSEREYRVFCPPRSKRVTGISQYQWHRPWLFAGEDDARQIEVVNRVTAEAERICGLILEDLDEKTEMDRLLVEQGFSFDLLFDEKSGVCELVELNGFGVRSSCGSCLFQWLKDREQLYSGEEVEFRVTM